MTKRNIAAMARDNQIPMTKRYDEEVIFEDDGEIVLQKRDYGEELGPDANYDDIRDKNDRKLCKSPACYVRDFGFAVRLNRGYAQLTPISLWNYSALRKISGTRKP